MNKKIVLIIGILSLPIFVILMFLALYLNNRDQNTDEAKAMSQEFEINDFSNDYYATVTINSTDNRFHQGSITVYDKNQNDEIIKVSSESFPFILPTGAFTSNIHDAPYGEHSPIIYNDFNFDKVNDFAIIDSPDGCYGGPHYQIFLNDNNEFTYSKTFSDLTFGNCGFFINDYEKKQIYTMTKSGCCSHYYDVYIVDQSIPVKIKGTSEYLEVIDGEKYVTTNIQELIDGEWVTTSEETKQISEQ